MLKQLDVMEFNTLINLLKYLCFLIFFQIIPPLYAFASESSIRFEQISIEHGLPQSSAKAILQDRLGFIWVGMEEGLARYDGYEFKVFKKKLNDTQSISNNYVTTIIEGKNGYIWVGTRAGGLNRFNPATEKFTRYQYQENNHNSISSNNIHAIAQDDAGNIWIGTDGAGLNQFNPDTERFTHFRHQVDNTNSISSDAISDVFIDKEGHIWIGTWGPALTDLIRILENLAFFNMTTMTHLVSATTPLGILLKMKKKIYGWQLREAG